MFGKNPKLKPDYSNGSTLKVHSIFKTLQGEGPYVGYPSIFIRLSGCNLACNFCDTEFDSYSEMNIEDIVNRNEFQQDYKPLIVITGGEPMRQNISLLSKILIDRGYIVQVESNGTIISPELPKEVKIVCSPKVTNGRYHKIRSDILERAIAIKFIVSAHYREYSDIGYVGQDNIPTYIQPMDEYNYEKNKRNLELAIKLSYKYNYILSIQIHKIIGIE